jgi:small subunit ribosomal protein S4
MAKYNGPVCRLCRREGMKLFLKGERCFSDKCSIERRNYPPGQHGQARPRFSDYGNQLREKQKVRRIYSVLERQFRRTVAEANRLRGVAGENLMALLERRLDNTVYRLGFASSRAEARQLVRHGHFTLRGRRVTIPSALVRKGDVIALTARGAQTTRIEASLDAVDAGAIPGWLSLNKGTKTGEVMSDPSREQITIPIQEQLIVELYAK